MVVRHLAKITEHANHTWLAVGDVKIECNNDHKSDKCHHPRHQEHDSNAHQSSNKAHPCIVIL